MENLVSIVQGAEVYYLGNAGKPEKIVIMPRHVLEEGRAYVEKARKGFEVAGLVTGIKKGNETVLLSYNMPEKILLVEPRIEEGLCLSMIKAFLEDGTSVRIEGGSFFDVSRKFERVTLEEAATRSYDLLTSAQSCITTRTYQEKIRLKADIFGLEVVGDTHTHNVSSEKEIKPSPKDIEAYVGSGLFDERILLIHNTQGGFKLFNFDIPYLNHLLNAVYDQENVPFKWVVGLWINEQINRFSLKRMPNEIPAMA